MTQKDYLIIYHREDNDGVFSAAIIEDYLINSLGKKLEDLVFIGADYNMLSDFANDKSNTPEKLHNDFKHIVMTDISFNDAKFMKKLFKEFGSDFTWIDHHAPIIQESIKMDFDEIVGVRDTQRSAILNAWKFLYDPFDLAYNKHQVPELLRILSGWDSWSYEREGYEFDYVRNINKATTIKYNLELGKACEVVHSLVDVYVNGVTGDIMSVMEKDKPLIEQLHEFGKQINDYDDITMEGIIKTSGDCSWQVRFEDGDKGRPLFHKACAIFHQGATNSTMFKCLKNKGINHGLVFKRNPNGNWVMSMYNINEDEWTHCGEFLKERYNGGGHKGAAGCTLTETQFIKILKSKTI